MAPIPPPIGRRTFIAGAAATGALVSQRVPPAAAAGNNPILRTIPASGERIPAIGMGTWITFNVGNSRRLRDSRAAVLKAFFDRGGTVVDSSPMYGTSEEVIGYCLGKTGRRDAVFSATKVWTPLTGNGIGQMATSRKLWDLPAFDLMQIHNLVNWEEHLETLAADKAAGKIRHIGITTSHGRRHGDFEQVMADDRIDTVQFTYNMLDRAAERRLLPMAAERDLAVIINRPFQARGAFRPLRPQSAAAMGGGIRLHQLGAVFPEIRDFAPGGDLRDTGNIPDRSYAGKHGGALWPPARSGNAPSHDQPHRKPLTPCCPTPPRFCSPSTTNTTTRSGRFRRWQYYLPPG